MGVYVITDSICAPALNLVNELEIKIVPLTIHLGGSACRDLWDIQPDELYKSMRALKVQPSISSPAKDDFFEALQSALGEENYLICFTSSSVLFETFAAAADAIEALPDGKKERVSLIDTGTAGAAAGLLVTEAARLAREGLSTGPIVSRINPMLSKCKLLFMAGSFKYFALGSRKKQMAALAADLLTIKPVYCMTEGEVFLTGRLRGKKKARAHILESLFETTAEAGQVWVAVTHADAYKEACLLRDEIAKTYPQVNAEPVPFTPAMGTRAGPGVLGIGYTFI